VKKEKKKIRNDRRKGEKQDEKIERESNIGEVK